MKTLIKKSATGSVCKWCQDPKNSSHKCPYLKIKVTKQDLIDFKKKLQENHQIIQDLRKNLHHTQQQLRTYISNARESYLRLLPIVSEVKTKFPMKK